MKNNVPFADSFCSSSKNPTNNAKKDDFIYSCEQQININWRIIAAGTGTYMSWTEDHDK